MVVGGGRRVLHFYAIVEYWKLADIRTMHGIKDAGKARMVRLVRVSGRP